MSLRTVMTFAVGLSLLTGCTPKFKVAVPEGWQVAKELNNDEVQAKLLVNEQEQVAIKVFCVAAEKAPVAEVMQSMIDGVNEVQGQIVEQNLADDKSSSRLVFTATVDGVDTAGRQVVKLSGYKHAKTLIIFGFWPAEKDAVAAKAFEAIAASADFK